MSSFDHLGLLENRRHMATPIVDHPSIFASEERAAESRRFVKALADWSFIALVWILALAILFYPTLHVVVFIGFCVRFALLRDHAGKIWDSRSTRPLLSPPRRSARGCRIVSDAVGGGLRQSSAGGTVTALGN